MIGGGYAGRLTGKRVTNVRARAVAIDPGRGDGLIQFVDRADRPRSKLLTGRWAAIYKEIVTRSPASSIAWERRLPGMLRRPSGGKALAARS